jgi:hypothetical protein
MKWFVIGLTIGFLNYNDHLQLHCNSTYNFYDMNVIKWIAWVAIDVTYHMQNHIHMYFVQFNCHYERTTTMKFQGN